MSNKKHVVLTYATGANVTQMKLCEESEIEAAMTAIVNADSGAHLISVAETGEITGPLYSENDAVIIAGLRFNIKVEDDYSNREPWEDDGHGPVSEWESRDKRPGEWILNTERGNSKRFYDACEANKIAKRDGWGLGDDERAALTATLGRVPTNGEVRQQAVLNDFEYLRTWCNNDWCYVGVIVELVDEDGDEIDNDSLWAIESNSDDFIRDVAAEMIFTFVGNHLDELNAANMEAAAVEYWNARDIVTTN